MKSYVILIQKLMEDIMDSLLFLGYEILAALGPLFIIYIVRNGLDRSLVLLSLFGIYLMMVFNVTAAGTLYDIFMYGFQWRGDQVNLIPFAGEENLMNNIMNVIMLVPFGFMATSFFKGKSKVVGTLVSGFSLIILIESSQLLNNRSTDIDDVIMNSLGLIIGIVIYKVCFILNKKFALIKIESPIKFRIMTVVTIIFISRFFLLNDFGLAKLIYGF